MKRLALFLFAVGLLALPAQSLGATEEGVEGSESSEIACIADACAVLPEAPEDPDPPTLVRTSGNPPPEYIRREPEKNKRGHHRKHKKSRHGRQGR